jgi:hypothetical protein
MNPTITTGTVSLVITIVGGWLWVSTYFITRVEANDAHEAAQHSISETLLEMRIDQANTEMLFMEQEGLENLNDDDQRDYDLLKFKVQRMTQQQIDMDEAEE